MSSTARRTGGPADVDDSFADAEPPPAYSAVAETGNSTLEANFSRPYEVQDSGAFSQPASSSAPAPSHQHYPHPANPPPPPPQHPTRTGNNGYSHPPGPPPSSSSSLYQSSLSRTPSSRIPEPHIDGVSTFNRPALPNQAPAHTVSARPVQEPGQYSPTTYPMSGQPLLYKGKLLVYRDGFTCAKCHNTGYKAYDPSMPHEKCWDKYGRLFTSAIRTAPNFHFSNANLQKPLPNLRYQATVPPQPQHVPVISSPPPPPPLVNQQHPGYYVAGQQQPPPQQQWQPHSYQPQPQQYMQSQLPQQQPPQHYGPPQQHPTISHHTGLIHPPPGALVVQPGDPRIGGRLCYNCGGRGNVACGFLLMDEETCRMCNGTGRVFF